MHSGGAASLVDIEPGDILHHMTARPIGFAEPIDGAKAQQMIAHAASREIGGMSGPLELSDKITGPRVHRSEKIGSTSAGSGGGV